MSSETSTEADALQPWQLFTLAGLIGATIVVFLSQGHTPAGIILLSLTIFAAAAVGLAAWRTFAPLSRSSGIVGIEQPTSLPVVGGRTRAALEREKALVLRSIKELEFDKAMGKVSDKDFAEMSARLRLRAAGLIRQLDPGVGYRKAIENEIERRVGPAAAAAAVATRVTCRHCGADADADARFCKRCGSSLETTE
jgi:hypothetical protein